MKPLNLPIPSQGHRSIIEEPGTCGRLAGWRPGVRQTRTQTVRRTVVLFLLAFGTVALAAAPEVPEGACKRSFENAGSRSDRARAIQDLSGKPGKGFPFQA